MICFACIMKWLSSEYPLSNIDIQLDKQIFFMWKLLGFVLLITF